MKIDPIMSAVDKSREEDIRMMLACQVHSIHFSLSPIFLFPLLSFFLKYIYIYMVIMMCIHFNLYCLISKKNKIK
jgi:hypothetical protein